MMFGLKFASADEALQHLADLIGQRVVVADEVKTQGEQKEGEGTFKTKLVDEDGNKGPLLTVIYEWTAVKKDQFHSVKLVDLYITGVKSAGQLKSMWKEDPVTGDKERSYYRKLELITKDLTKEEVERLEVDAIKDFTDNVAKKVFKTASAEDAEACLADVISRRRAIMAHELKFASADEALQHLADLTGKRVKVSGDQSSTYPDFSALRKIGSNIEEIVKKWYFDGFKGKFGGQGFHGLNADYDDDNRKTIRKFFPEIKGDLVMVYVDYGSADDCDALSALEKRMSNFSSQMVIVDQGYSGLWPFFFKNGSDAKYFVDRMKELADDDEYTNMGPGWTIWGYR